MGTANCVVYASNKIKLIIKKKVEWIEGEWHIGNLTVNVTKFQIFVRVFIVNDKLYIQLSNRLVGHTYYLPTLNKCSVKYCFTVY